MSDLLSISVHQINTTGIDETDFVSHDTLGTVSDNVDTVQSNVSTLETSINTVNANVDALPDSAANDYTTYTTVTGLIDTVQDNVDSLTSTVDSADANLYNTYTSLSASIDTVQDNVGAGASGNVTVFGVSDQFTVAGANTFTLSQTVTNPKDIIVSLSGVIQYPTVGYTVSGTTLTIANTTPLKAGLDLEVRHLIGEPGARGNAWEEVSSDASLNGRSRIIVDTTSSAVTLTLPLNPSLGDEVRVIDGAGNSSNNAITLYGNGANIEAETSNVLIDVDRSAFTMIYYNTYHGWLFGEK